MFFFACKAKIKENKPSEKKAKKQVSQSLTANNIKKSTNNISGSITNETNETEKLLSWKKETEKALKPIPLKTQKINTLGQLNQDKTKAVKDNKKYSKMAVMEKNTKLNNIEFKQKVDFEKADLRKQKVDLPPK